MKRDALSQIIDIVNAAKAVLEAHEASEDGLRDHLIEGCLKQAIKDTEDKFGGPWEECA